MSFPTVLSISGFDSTGRCGLLRDAAVFADERVNAAAVSTGTLHPNPTSFSIFSENSMVFEKQLRAVLEECTPQAIKVGFLPTRALAKSVEILLASTRIPLILDPFWVDPSGRPLSPEIAGSTLRTLLARATLIAVHSTHANSLIDPSEEDSASLQKKIRIFPSAKTNVPLSSLTSQGTGCEFSSRIAAKLAKGLPLDRAVDYARRQLEEHLEQNVREETEELAGRERIRRYSHALESLLSELQPECVPEVASNLAWAPLASQNPSHVVGLAGRIAIAGKGFAVAGRPAHGGPHHTGRIALTLQRLAGGEWWVLNHRFRDETWNRVAQRPDALLLERTQEPSEFSSTMEWLTQEAFRTLGKPPTFLADRGSVGKEAMIRILAPTEQALFEAHRVLHGSPRS